MSEFPEEKQEITSEMDSELTPIETKKYKKRFTDLLKSDIIRKNPTKYSVIIYLKILKIKTRIRNIYKALTIR